VDGDGVDSAQDIPYDIPNLRVEFNREGAAPQGGARPRAGNVAAVMGVVRAGVRIPDDGTMVSVNTKVQWFGSECSAAITAVALANIAML